MIFSLPHHFSTSCDKKLCGYISPNSSSGIIIVSTSVFTNFSCYCHVITVLSPIIHRLLGGADSRSRSLTHTLAFPVAQSFLTGTKIPLFAESLCLYYVRRNIARQHTKVDSFHRTAIWPDMEDLLCMRIYLELCGQTVLCIG